jgi:hypothetical protein
MFWKLEIRNWKLEIRNLVFWFLFSSSQFHFPFSFVSLCSVLKLFVPADNWRSLAARLKPASMLPSVPPQAQENGAFGTVLI